MGSLTAPRTCGRVRRLQVIKNRSSNVKNAESETKTNYNKRKNRVHREKEMFPVNCLLAVYPSWVFAQSVAYFGCPR